MFDSKQQQLFSKNKQQTTSVTGNFVSAGLKKSAETVSDNGAKKYSTTGNPFVDQFAKLGSYKAPRSFKDIEADCEVLWAKSPLITIVFLFYIRMITRVVTLFNGVSTKVSQKGGEMRHEGIFRMIWLHTKAPAAFWKNIGLFISIGSWKDIIMMLSYDLQYNSWDNRQLDWKQFGDLILTGLENKNTSELLKKYLPTIKSNNKCTTLESQADNLIGKWICSLLFGNKGEESGHTYKKYRRLKSMGTAHQWQQLISQAKFDRIDFGKIHGRALNLLVRSKFLANQGLSEKYAAWVAKPETEVKYTGFVHELFSKLPRQLSGLTQGEQDTINKQFDTLVQKAGETLETSLIVVRDTSGSMGGAATGTTMTCADVSRALGLYFSTFLRGYFSDSWIEFNSEAAMHQWKGNTPLEKWYNDKTGYVGSTNFQSVIKMFVNIKAQGVPENEFPKGILCISDMEFNPTTSFSTTNVDAAKEALRRDGFSEEYVNSFVIVLWNLQNSGRDGKGGQKFETYGNVENVFYFSGYSAAVVSFLSGKIKNAEDLFDEAMSQEILGMIEL